MHHTVKTRVLSSFRESGECTLPADLAAVEPAAELLLGFLRQRGAAPDDLSAVELASVEGLNNAIKHGTAGRNGAVVTLAWQLAGIDLAIAIGDPGHFAPGPEWLELPADPLDESGRGGFLMRSSMDDVRQENRPGGHTLHLRKRLAPLKPPPPAADMERELTAMTQDLSDSYESLAALFSISELLATTPEFSTFLNEVLARLRTIIGAEKAYVRFIMADGTWQLGGKSSARDTRVPFQNEPSALELQAWAARREISVEQTDPLREGDPLRSMRAGGFICPIAFANQTIGVLVVGRREGNFFSAGQLNLVRTVGDYLAIACTTAELQKQREAQQRVAREFQIAASIQQSLLPRRMPVVPGWQIEGLCHSAHEVGGDYFDVIEHPGRGFLVVIADVMGKGLPAALLATIFRTAVRARADLASEPGRLLTVINRQFHDDLAELGIFITAQVAWFEAASTRIRMACAGQADAMRIVHGADSQPALMLRCEGEMPLGITADVTYPSEEFTVDAGDALLFVTDGLYEIEGTDGQLLGLDGLASLARHLWTGEPVSFARALLDTLSNYGRQGQVADDRTLVVVHRISAP
jgi:serine phosphatase RsbU (regulator of sigma subunit)/anti-sigma regulatory factor (Ser/Thr protein kinase)